MQIYYEKVKLLYASHYKLAVLMSKSFARFRCDLNRYRQMWLRCKFLVQEVDPGPLKSKINDITFELDA